MTDWSAVQLALNGPSDSERKISEEFSTFWRKVEKDSEEMGWSHNPGSIVQRYFDKNERSVAATIFVTPQKRDRFLFRVHAPRHALEQIRDALVPVASRLPGASVSIQRIPGPKGTKVDVVDVRSTWEDVIGDDQPTGEVVTDRLHSFVTPLLRAVPRV